MEMLDSWTFEKRSHSYRVARLALMIGEQMNLSERELFVLGVGSLLHDIGKMRIPRDILLKPGKLTESEWEVMRRHPEFGLQILDRFPSLQFAKEIVGQHQERWDGSGYPEGLVGKEIVLGARIFAVADSYDAMTNQRSYNVVKSFNEALVELTLQSGILYDPEVFQGFVKLGNPGFFESNSQRKCEFLDEVFSVEGFIGLFVEDI
ncbi:MAG: HD-GYP domain-containing protein [Leptospirales bacterium]